jgi:LysM repeat protein
MTALVSIMVPRVYGAARLLCWCLGVATAAALMWLAAALFGGMTAAAGTPLLSGTASAAARYRTDPATVTTGQPRDPTATTPRVEPVSMTSPLATPPNGTATSTAEAPAPASDVWDQVAQCESGGRWNISTGNGHHGGLQFTPSTWKAYGGGKYASTANQATKQQQIEIAKKVLAGQGPGAWPHCGRKAGLSRANGGAATGTATGSAPKHATTPAPKAGTEAPKPKYKPTDKATKTTNTGTDNARDKARDNKVSKYHTTTKAHHGKATNQHKHSRKPQGKAQRTATKDTVVVRSGDTLSALATSHHIKGGWQALYEANKDKIDNPHTIHPNQKLSLPRS